MAETTALTTYDGAQLAPIVETNATAGAALAEARVKARSVVALNRPRDMDLVRVKLLKECDRPGFAAVARYALPRSGKTIVGPSVRFAEAAARALTNLDVFAEIIFDDTNKRILQITAVDLESNHSESFPVVVDKVMERRELKRDEVAIGTRTNSTGAMVYLVAVPESEMPVRQGAAVAKIRRNLILAHLPGDILEEAMRAVEETTKREDKRDPDAARKQLVDAFAEIGVLPDALKTFLGCDLSAASPAQTQELRAVYVGIKEGAATWAEVIAEKTGSAPAGAGKVSELKDALAAKLAAKKKRSAAKPNATPPSSEPQHDPITGEVVPEPGSDG